MGYGCRRLGARDGAGGGAGVRGGLGQPRPSPGRSVLPWALPPAACSANPGGQLATIIDLITSAAVGLLADDPRQHEFLQRLGEAGASIPVAAAAHLHHGPVPPDLESVLASTLEVLDEFGAALCGLDPVAVPSEPQLGRLRVAIRRPVRGGGRPVLTLLSRLGAAEGREEVAAVLARFAAEAVPT